MGNIMSNNMSSLHSSNGGLCEVDDPWDLYRGAKGIDEVDVHRRLWRKAKEDNILSSNNMTLPTDDESHHEIEILGEGPEGAESQNQWEKCEKNKGHIAFVPFKSFSMRSLPQGFQNYENFEKFKKYANLTVRLRVHHTSQDRPANKNDSITPLRGTDKLRTGSGLITGVYAGEEECPCSECCGKSMKKHWFIYVRTVNHVVYNTRVAVDTKIDMFCDDEKAHVDGAMKSLWGLDVVTTDPGDDFCTLRCVTHDETLALQLQDYTKSLGQRSEFQPHWLFVNWNKFFVLIISHPHGKPKMVTVGELKWVVTRNSEVLSSPMVLEDYSCEYDTPTCHGCSGAPVINLRLREREPQIPFMEMNGFVHSGSKVRFGSRVNHSTLSNSYTTITPGGIEVSKAPYKIVHMVKTEHYDSSQVKDKHDSPIYVPH